MRASCHWLAHFSGYRCELSTDPSHHFYFEELLSDDPQFVFLELMNSAEFSVMKETFEGRSMESLTVQITNEILDEIAISWIKKRKLQGAVGGSSRPAVARAPLASAVASGPSGP